MLTVFTCEVFPERVLRISTDENDRMGHTPSPPEKIIIIKYPHGFFSKIRKIPGPNFNPPKIICLSFEPEKFPESTECRTLFGCTLFVELAARTLPRSFRLF